MIHTTFIWWCGSSECIRGASERFFSRRWRELELVVDPRRVATDQRAQCQRQQGDASLNLEFTFIQAAKSFFFIPQDRKYRLCFGIPIVSFFGEFGI